MFWEVTCTHRIFWFQKIKQRLIRTVRGLNCLNSPVPLLLMQMCAQHVSLEELQIVSFQRSQEHPDVESQDKLQVAILWKLLIYTAHRRSTEKHASDHHTRGQFLLCPETTSSTHSKPKSAIPESFSHEKYNFKISFYLPCLHCAFISMLPATSPRFY